MKLAAGTFLAGASSRLLPASIPFRYFGAAVAFHFAAWVALFADADVVPRFAGGLGWPVASLHLVTLGTLAMTAIGASLQLLPVATRQPVAAGHGPAAIWWLYTPGVAAIAAGMGTATIWLLAAGAVAVIVALSLYAALLAGNLAGAKGMPTVIAHGWVALGSLVVVLASAVSLAGAYAGLVGLARPTALAFAHRFRCLRIHGDAGAWTFLHPGAHVRVVGGARRSHGTHFGGARGGGPGPRGHRCLRHRRATVVRGGDHRRHRRGSGASAADADRAAHRYAPRTGAFVPAGAHQLGTARGKSRVGPRHGPRRAIRGNPDAVRASRSSPVGC